MDSQAQRWMAVEQAEVNAAHAAAAKLYFEFLRVPALSMGLYVLAAGSDDPQQPHREDEIYYVVQGRGVINVDGTDTPVREGSIIYVAANIAHHFHSIVEELRVLVFFAPAESE